MRGLAEHLGLLVLQQRGAATALESELHSLAEEVHAIRCLTAGVSSVETVDDAAALTRSGQALPPQTVLRKAVETQRQGLRRASGAVSEVQLLLTAMEKTDIPSSSDLGSLEEGLADASTLASLKDAVSGLGKSVSGMLGRFHPYPSCYCPADVSASGGVVVQGENAPVASLLPASAAHAVQENQKVLKDCSEEARSIAGRFANVAPPAALIKVGEHLGAVVSAVDATLDASPAMVVWLAGDECGGSNKETEESVDTEEVTSAQTATAAHAGKIRHQLSEAVKALLISVQSLSTKTDANHDCGNPVTSSDVPVVTDGGTEDVEPQEWQAGTTLLDAHASAFEQARSLKLWRCAFALASVRLAFDAFSDDEAVYGDGSKVNMLDEAGGVMVKLACGVLDLAQQVLLAGRAVLIGMVALNKVSHRYTKGFEMEGGGGSICELL